MFDADIVINESSILFYLELTITWFDVERVMWSLSSSSSSSDGQLGRSCMIFFPLKPAVDALRFYWLCNYHLSNQLLAIR